MTKPVRRTPAAAPQSPQGTLTARVARIAAIDARAQSTASASVSDDAVSDWILSRTYIIYNPDFALMLGSADAAILLGRIFFWSNTPTAKERDGWFYWKQVDITQQTGLQRRITDSAKRLLKERGILEIELRGMPQVCWFRLNKKEFFRQLRVFISTLEE